MFIQYTRTMYVFFFVWNLPKLGGIGGHVFGLSVPKRVWCIFPLSNDSELLVAFVIAVTIFADVAFCSPFRNWWLTFKLVRLANITSVGWISPAGGCGVAKEASGEMSGRGDDATAAGIVSFARLGLLLATVVSAVLLLRMCMGWCTLMDASALDLVRLGHCMGLRKYIC